MYVLNFVKTSPSPQVHVIRLLRRGGCLPKTSRIKFILPCSGKCSGQLSNVEKFIAMLTFISFFLAIQFLVQAATNFKL